MKAHANHHNNTSPETVNQNPISSKPAPRGVKKSCIKLAEFSGIEPEGSNKVQTSINQEILKVPMSLEIDNKLEKKPPAANVVMPSKITIIEPIGEVINKEVHEIG